MALALLFGITGRAIIGKVMAGLQRETGHDISITARTGSTVVGVSTELSNFLQLKTPVLSSIKILLMTASGMRDESDRVLL